MPILLIPWHFFKKFKKSADIILEISKVKMIPQIEFNQSAGSGNYNFNNTN